MEGGSIRLVTIAPAAGSTHFNGVIQIELEPGWKTYWRNPGDAGVPPNIDVSASTNIAGAVFDYPAPERHDDGYGAWTGYSASTSFPVTFSIAAAGKPVQIEADLFLGLCQTICVPVQTRFSLDPLAGDDEEDKAEVEAALAALPRPADERFNIRPHGRDGALLSFDATLPEGEGAPELFLDGGGKIVFGVPQGSKRDGSWLFMVPALSEPAFDESGKPVFYTLKSDRGAVSGTVSLP